MLSNLAGPNYRFVSRQLLLLGTMLDFSDVSNRKVASEFLQALLHKALDHELDDNGNEVIIGDGFNLGGERNWAAAVAELGKKVHAATGEFEEVVLNVVVELAQPCRERTADWKQWLHCLAVVGLLLENTTSFRHMRGSAIDPTEILHSLLLPGVCPRLLWFLFISCLMGMWLYRVCLLQLFDWLTGFLLLVCTYRQSIPTWMCRGLLLGALVFLVC